MDYSFAEVHDQEIFKGKHGLSGTQIIVENYEDCTITHRFQISGIVRKSGGKTWYAIKNHTTTIDKTDAIRRQLREQSDALAELAELIEGGE